MVGSGLGSLQAHFQPAQVRVADCKIAYVELEAKLSVSEVMLRRSRRSLSARCGDGGVEESA